MDDRKEIIERLQQLTGKTVVLTEAKYNSLTQLKDAFKTRDCKPSESSITLGKDTYTFSKAIPEKVSSRDLFRSSAQIEMVYKNNGDSLIFTFKIKDCMIAPSSVRLDKKANND